MIRIALITFVLALAALVYFPYIQFYDQSLIERKVAAVEQALPDLPMLDSYLLEKELGYPHLRRGLEKSITWNDASKKEQTEYSLVYLPGFTATRKEIAPVVEELAKKFNANSFFSRLPSHGEEADDYSNSRTEDFFETAKEAVLIGEKLGKKPIFVGLSTGAALLQYTLEKRKSGYAFIALSPAFYGRYHYMNVALNPWVGLGLVKLIIGQYYEWAPHFPTQELFWNTKYNTDILPHMTRVFQLTSRQDYNDFSIPYFLIFNEHDSVIDHTVMLEKWRQAKNPMNKTKSIVSRDLHVVAGDITSPENTKVVIDDISNWLVQIK